ncbi:MAG: hypothetical protein LBL69_01360 [Zoogloeaceae bacterium]|jgi:hypothetical protein|nr:hypothetical protein [Zoogloeaceae bacterium]
MNRRNFLHLCGLTGAATCLPDIASGKPALTSLTLGWYCWRGADWLRRPAMLDDLPTGTWRLLLSFDAIHLAQLASAPASLQTLAQQARKKRVALEWLLGDPTLASSSGRAALQKWIARVPAGIFSVIHLDLERAQLPKSMQSNWPAEVVATVQAAHRASGLPVGLTTHHRDLHDSAFLKRLAEAGAQEVVPMIYVTNAARVSEIAQSLPKTAGLRLSVAQSVEKALPAAESTFAQGRQKTLAHWRALVGQLADEHAADVGILAQSWEDWQECHA